MSARGRNRRRRSRPQSSQQRNRGRRPSTGLVFWGDPAALPEAHSDVRMTVDPAAVPRSLGPPPLPGHETAAEHYFAAVYDRAVTTAGALAAAGGMIDPETLVSELGQ